MNFYGKINISVTPAMENFHIDYFSTGFCFRLRSPGGGNFHLIIRGYKCVLYCSRSGCSTGEIEMYIILRWVG